LVNQDGVLLDGHHRFRTCQELGIEPQYKTIVYKDKVEERLFVSRSNLEGKGRQLNNFRRTELALKSKPDLKEIAKRRILAGKTLTRNQERVHVDKEIAKMANVSHDTVKKVEKIVKSLEEEDLKKLRSEEVSINQAYNRILDHERLEEIHTAIEPLRPQMEGIIKEWEELGKDSLGQFIQLYKTGPDMDSFAQQKEDIRNRFEEFGICPIFRGITVRRFLVN
jgi:ParB-like chromosome segregation protein Spo0J